MNIFFSPDSLSRELSQHKKRMKKYGAKRAQLITQRLDELAAAETLEVMRSIVGARCHEYTGNRKGEFSVDLDHPYRLLFKPIGEKIHKSDGGVDWSLVRAIVIHGVEDPHG
jgi:plasmid maintenance system killer protein